MKPSKYAWSEIVADIAYECGRHEYHTASNHETWLYTMEDMIDWAEEFDKRHKKTDWDETDYWETMEDFISEKIGSKKKKLFNNEQAMKFINERIKLAKTVHSRAAYESVKDFLKDRI